MKRFWLILLSLGLVMAFSASAFAVDVKVGAEYYAAGLYLNKTSLYDGPDTIIAYKYDAKKAKKGKTDKAWKRDKKDDEHVNEAGSTAFFFQRLRVGTDFICSPSLKLVTRFDAMERIWGGQRSSVGTEDSMSAGTRAENENIAFDLAYIDYTSPIGLFRVGYQKDYEWGTVFGDYTSGPTRGGITYIVPVGPVTILAQYIKEADKSASAVTTGVTTTDQDYDSYRLGAIYPFKKGKASGEVGGLLLWNRNATNKSGSAVAYPTYGNGYLENAYALVPYVKANIGPVAVQAEVQYTFGDAIKWEDTNGGLYTGTPPSGLGSPANVSISALSVFLDATATFGPAYVGGSFAYLSGDDPSTNDKLEGSNLLMTVNGAGFDWNPCLIMFNNDLRYWGGNISGHAGSVLDGEMSNAWFFQGRVGVKPTPQWDVMLAVSYAQVDKKPTGFIGGTYGTEVDLTGTYKITNNLTYVLGAGYFFAGDFFKGTGYDWKLSANSDTPPVGATPPNLANEAGVSEIQNDFMIMNKLILSF